MRVIWQIKADIMLIAYMLICLLSCGPQKTAQQTATNKTDTSANALLQALNAAPPVTCQGDGVWVTPGPPVESHFIYSIQ